MKYKLNNVEVSKEDIQELLKNNPELLEKEKKEYWWEPKVGEKYWYVTVLGEVCDIINTDCPWDRNRIMFSRVFRTEQEAIKERGRRKAEIRLRRWIANANEGWVPDFQNCEHKYYVFQYSKTYLNVDFCLVNQHFPTWIYLKSEELAQRFIKECGEDYKLWLELE